MQVIICLPICCAILTPMNYRRGLQRVYVVLTVAWIAVVLVLSIRDRPKPQFTTYVKCISDTPDTTLSSDPDCIPKPYDEPGRLWKYWAIRGSVAILAPGAIYLLLFSVLPWICHGFKPSG